MKMPKIKSKKASELIKSILTRDSNKFFPEIQKKIFTGKIFLPTTLVQLKLFNLYSFTPWRILKLPWS